MPDPSDEAFLNKYNLPVVCHNKIKLMTFACSGSKERLRERERERERERKGIKNNRFRFHWCFIEFHVFFIFLN
jgi:hypothetical protein